MPLAVAVAVRVLWAVTQAQPQAVVMAVMGRHRLLLVHL
jgi:hypothetical protein